MKRKLEKLDWFVESPSIFFEKQINRQNQTT